MRGSRGSLQGRALRCVALHCAKRVGGGGSSARWGVAMSRIVRCVLFKQALRASERRFRNNNIFNSCNLAEHESRITNASYLTSSWLLTPLRHTIHGYFNYVGLSKGRKPGEIHKLLTVSGILTFLGLQKDESERESELITTMKRGVLLTQRGEFKKAEQMLHIALKIAQEQQNVEAVTYIYDLLANVAYEACEFVKAERLFVNVLQRLLSSGTAQNDNKVLHISLKLASIYKENGEPVKAEEGFKFCEDNLRKKVDAGAVDEDTLLLWAMTLDWYARFVLEKGRYKEAFTFFEKAYKTSVNVNGPIHEQNVVLLNDMGTVCCLLNNYDEAIRYLSEAVRITKKLPDMEDAASIYINLGTVYLKNMMLEEAKQACREGWRNAKSRNNKEALEEASICLDELRMKQTA